MQIDVICTLNVTFWQDEYSNFNIFLEIKKLSTTVRQHFLKVTQYLEIQNNNQRI